MNQLFNGVKQLLSSLHAFLYFFGSWGPELLAGLKCRKGITFTRKRGCVSHSEGACAIEFGHAASASG
jgi:hypothetical protein